MKLDHLFEGLPSFADVLQRIFDKETGSSSSSGGTSPSFLEHAVQKFSPFRWTAPRRRLAAAAAGIITAVLAGVTVSQLLTLREQRRRLQLLRRCETEEPMKLFLFILPRSPWAPSLSPACTRIELFLRANAIPYTAIETMDAFGSPHGELPFLVYRGHRVDQTLPMLDFIGAEFHISMDDDLSRDERAIGAALRRTLEYSMERFLYRIAFIDHPALAITQVAKALPISRLRASLLVYRYARKLRSQLAITAYGALVTEQYENEFLLDCEALEAQIGSKAYLFGDEHMTSYDCAVYALLVPFAYVSRYTALSTAHSAVADSAVLMGYITRISTQFFADIPF